MHYLEAWLRGRDAVPIDNMITHAIELSSKLSLAREFEEFLTVPAYGTL